MKRLRLAHLPTPLEHYPRLSALLGVELWVKRDDCSGGAEAGNKIRKLEWLLADALERGCDSVVTCGGVQSNHARASAICAARVGLRAHLLLRAPTLSDDADGEGVAPCAAHAPSVGNVLLDQLVGAEMRLITAASYQQRDALLERHASRLRERGRTPYIIPEGGSNGLGALGYVHAMEEIRQQLDEGVAEGKPFDVVVHACGSGGTAAGVVLGAALFGVASDAQVMAVCDDAASFETRITQLMVACQRLDARLTKRIPWRVDDRAKGPAYAQASPQQAARLRQVARLSGLVLDPVYSGKAFSGLWCQVERGEIAPGARVLFLHTGGLPGLLAQPNILLDGGATPHPADPDAPHPDAPPTCERE